MVCYRIQSRIIRNQSADQAAYRPSYSTEDHLLSTVLLLERSAEWNHELWLGLVDFEKAFDTVEHNTLWKALLEQGVEANYVQLIMKLYASQTAIACAGCESREFLLQRGVKQGDPMSGLLFLVVMEAVFRSLKSRWNRLNAKRSGQYYGVVVDLPEDPLTNLRFADDVLIVACCRADVAKMIADLQSESAKYGLKLHLGKTRILTDSGRPVPEVIHCRGLQVRTLPADESEKYFGRALSTLDFHEKEFTNRLNCGWKAFYKFKAVLTNTTVPLRLRIALFSSVITPTVLYACGAWTLTADMEIRLRRCRRRMLRWIIGISRMRDEIWTDYLKRATHIAEHLAEKHGALDWIYLYRLRKWSFAGKCARNDDGRWSTRLLTWQPFFRCLPHRDVGRPVKRWDDDIVKVAGGDWSTTSAKDQFFWRALHNCL